MALYQITVDCRIANKDYKEWEVVSNEEVGGYFPTVMQPVNWAPKKPVKPAKSEEPQAPEKMVKLMVKMRKGKMKRK